MRNGNSTGTHPSPAHILVVDDDVPLAKLLKMRLSTECYAVDVANDGEAALKAVQSNQYHLAILDLNMPKIDGLALLPKMRAIRPHIPVLVLTGCSTVEDRVRALDKGADDCVNKPFMFVELLARIRALLRRNPDVPIASMQVGNLTLSQSDRRVERSGQRIHLSGREFELLEYMMRNADRTVTRAMLVENVWKMPSTEDASFINVYVKYLRDKVDAGFEHKMIETIRGVGYRLSVAPS